MQSIVQGGEKIKLMRNNLLGGLGILKWTKVVGENQGKSAGPRAPQFIGGSVSLTQKPL